MSGRINDLSPFIILFCAFFAMPVIWLASFIVVLPFSEFNDRSHCLSCSPRQSPSLSILTGNWCWGSIVPFKSWNSYLASSFNILRLTAPSIPNKKELIETASNNAVFPAPFLPTINVICLSRSTLTFSKHLKFLILILFNLTVHTSWVNYIISLPTSPSFHPVLLRVR